MQNPHSLFEAFQKICWRPTPVACPAAADRARECLDLAQQMRFRGGAAANMAKRVVVGTIG